MNEPLRNIVIVGGGTAGWVTAAMLARFVPVPTRIHVVASEVLGTVGVGEATIPQIQLLTSALGLDENKLLAATEGTFKLGIEFVDWLRPGHRYMHAFGQVGRALGVVPFHHHWLRGRAAGHSEPLEAYIPAARAAAAGRFGRRDTPMDLAYAYHFDASLLAALLRRVSEAAGVAYTDGTIVEVRQVENGDVAELVLADGRIIQGDFFIDCSGFRSLLVGETLGVGYEDWSAWLPCDRAVAVSSAGDGTLPPFTRATARPVGWQWRIPLQHRVGNGLVYASQDLSDDEAAARLLGAVDGLALGDPRPLCFTAGKRHTFWERNVIAMGLASGFIEPLESTSIHLVQSAVARLFQFFPSRTPDPAARKAYNYQTHAEIDRIRDFLILHYHLNERDEPFWRRLRDMPIPAELDDKLRQFRSGGRITAADGELFTEPGWLQVMTGQGLTPERWSPLVDGLPDAKLAAFLSDVAAAAAAPAMALPIHADFVTHHCRAPKNL